MALTLTRKSSTEPLENRPGCIAAALGILGDKWSPLLLSQLVGGSKKFSDLETSLIGISPRTLSARLDKLIVESVVEKQLYCKHPPRYKYQLTKKGSDLVNILQAMSQWGDKYHS